MKRIAAFVLGFSLIAAFAVGHLARRDPEPDMAGLSLLFFGLFALLGCLGAFLLSASRAQSWPKLIIAPVTGVASAFCFYAVLGYVLVGVGLFMALALSFALALAVAWASPRLLRGSA